MWAARTTGKGIRVVGLAGDEQGRAPFFAQPVGFDGRAFFVAADHGCDSEKLLHEVCHWLVAPRERRGQPNYGLGPGPVSPGREVTEAVRDNEEVTTMLLELRLAPHFDLPESKIARPDYNVANRKNLDWDACEARAQSIYNGVVPSLP